MKVWKRNNLDATYQIVNSLCGWENRITSFMITEVSNSSQHGVSHWRCCSWWISWILGASYNSNEYCLKASACSVPCGTQLTLKDGSYCLETWLFSVTSTLQIDSAEGHFMFRGLEKKYPLDDPGPLNWLNDPVQYHLQYPAMASQVSAPSYDPLKIGLLLTSSPAVWVNSWSRK